MPFLFNSSMKGSLYTALFIAFIDYLGLSLVYTIFSSMFFDPACPILPLETSNAARGWCLGSLFCLMPLTQFFAAPIWGALSDSKGRKKPLILSLLISLAGYLVGFGSLFTFNLPLLFLSRIFIGFGAGNTAIVQATLADISTKETKTKNFGLHGMALGLGFALGPFCGGVLSCISYSLPFAFAGFFVILNIIFSLTFFKETLHTLIPKKLSWHMGLLELKKAFYLPNLRVLFLCSFLSFFGWAYFFEFIPVFLIKRFQLSVMEVGVFFGISGLFYAISSGVLIRPFINRFKTETLFFGGLLFSSFSVFLMPFIPSAIWIFPLIFLVDFSIAFIPPTATTLISNTASASSQGETLGIFTSVTAAAFSLSPLFAGSLVGKYPTFPMWIGGSVMLFAACIYSFTLRKKLSN
jgi:MFS transporter, DHA1 family, tetracycline resistance protein